MVVLAFWEKVNADESIFVPRKYDKSEYTTIIQKDDCLGEKDFMCAFQFRAFCAQNIQASSLLHRMSHLVRVRL